MKRGPEYADNSNNANHSKRSRFDNRNNSPNNGHNRQNYFNPHKNGNNWRISTNKQNSSQPFRFPKLNQNQKRYTNTLNTTPSVQTDKLDKMSNSIYNYFTSNSQSYETYLKKKQLRDAIYAILYDIIPYVGVYIVGSSANGFGTNKSDVDICVMVSHDQIDQKTEAMLLLKILEKGFREAKFLRNVKVISAKVPIMKFKDIYNSLECDLNINNSNGIRNTHLLKYYSELDWRVKPLVLIVKKWAKCKDINDASKQTISSYSLVLMVIFYLQNVCSPKILPVLQDLYPDFFSASSDITTLDLNKELEKWVTTNEQSLGELFLGFLEYYANFENNVISVRLGALVPKSNYTFYADYSQWKHLSIEEPFELTNTARSVYDSFIFERIVDVFRASYDEFSRTHDIDSILKKRTYHE